LCNDFSDLLFREDLYLPPRKTVVEIFHLTSPNRKRVVCRANKIHIACVLLKNIKTVYFILIPFAYNFVKMKTNMKKTVKIQTFVCPSTSETAPDVTSVEYFY